jgi:hypothetical protein
MKSKLQSLYSKQRNAGKRRLHEPTLFNPIHKDSFDFEGLGADTLTSCELNPFVSIFPGFSVHSLVQRVGSTLPFFVVTISIKSRLFESPRKKVNSVVAARIFSPNYFEYRLWFPTAWLYSPGGSAIS